LSVAATARSAEAVTVFTFGAAAADITVAAFSISVREAAGAVLIPGRATPSGPAHFLVAIPRRIALIIALGAPILVVFAEERP